MEYVMLKLGLESHLGPIGQIHGKSFDAEVGYAKIKVLPLYHSAVAIYNRSKKDLLIKDFQMLKQL